MGILSGVVSYLLGLIINLLDVAITGFLGALGFNLNIFETYFPAAKAYYDVIVGFAVGLLFIMFIFQVFKNFGIVLEMEVEDPLKMLGKTALFFGMIMCSRSIADIITKLLVDPYNIFLDTYSATFDFSLLDLLWSFVGGIFMNGFTSVVYIIMLIVLGWQFLKFVVEIVERYIVFCFVLYCAPVVYATGAFKSTAQIFKSWTRMVASQGMLLLLNVWSIKLFISFMEGFSLKGDDLIFQFLLGYAFLKFSQKADTLLRILGLNTASTGEMVRSIGGTIGSIAQSVRAMGGMVSKAASGSGRGNGSTQSGSSSGGSDNGGRQYGGGSGPNPMGSPGGGNGGAQQGSGNPISGITGDATNTARDNYVNETLASAKAQMAENPNPSGDTTENKSNMASDSGVSDKENAGVRMNPQNSVGADTQRSHASIDGETREKLSQLARGMPHNQYDPAKKSFSGGGFQGFTGENANIIGSTQMPPADGFTQSQVKMPDGSFATMYRNNETGEAHAVHFGSVDNGVIQGTISSIDGNTGKMGDDMAFKAVHESVPGAASFSSHSSPVSDGSGGAYHVATGGDHSFFEAGTFRAASPISSDAAGTAAAPTSSYSNTVGPESTQSVSSAPASASGFTPGGASKMAAREVGPPPTGQGSAAPGHSSILQDIQRQHSTQISGNNAVPGSSGYSSFEATPGVAGSMGAPAGTVNPSAPQQPHSQSASIISDTISAQHNATSAPPVDSGMGTSGSVREPVSKQREYPDPAIDSSHLPDEKGRFDTHQKPE